MRKLLPVLAAAAALWALPALSQEEDLPVYVCITTTTTITVKEYMSDGSVNILTVSSSRTKCTLKDE